MLGLGLLWAVPAAAASGGSISGTVVAAADGTPLAGICVSVENGPGTVTDSLGQYSISGLDPGLYAAQYWDCTLTPSYVGQWYLGHPDSGSADKVTVIADSDTALAEVALAAGVSVHGTVTDVHGDADRRDLRQRESRQLRAVDRHHDRERRHLRHVTAPARRLQGAVRRQQRQSPVGARVLE